jgi:hypothetical protein
MKTLIFIFLLSTAASAATTTTTNTKAKHLSQDVNFEDQLVRGKYAYPDEAIATVEDDKWLNDLLAVRKNFKDRLNQSEFRN